MSLKNLLSKIILTGLCSVVLVSSVTADGPDDVANVAENQIGVKRSEGSAAITPERGFDCSGLTMYCYKKGANMNIGRTTQEQRYKGRIVGRDGLSKGDLVFFYPNWSHVGIYAGNGNVIHSSFSKKLVVKAPIWKDFVNGVKVIESVPKAIAIKEVTHDRTMFSATIIQDGCSGRSPHHNLCVDAAAENNGKVQLWNFGNGANQKWDFIPANDGPHVYFVGSKAPFLNGGNAFLTSYSDGRVTYEPFRPSKEQEWRFVELGTKHWLIQNVATGRYLDSGPHGNHCDSGTVYTNVRCGVEQEWTLQ